MKQMQEVEYAHDELESLLERLASVDTESFRIDSASVRINSSANGVYDVRLTRSGGLSVQPQRHGEGRG